MTNKIHSHNTNTYSKFPYKGYTICIEDTRNIESNEVTIHGFVPEIGYHTRVIANDTHIYGSVERGYSRVFCELKKVIDKHLDDRIGNCWKCDDEIDKEEYYSVAIGGGAT